MNIILFGFIGCGKTHYGKLLSKVLKWPFIDIDDLIVELYKERYGALFSVRIIHETLGETAFRELENRAICQLEINSRSVIAVGGGAVLNSSNIIYLQQIGRLVYLKVDFECVQKRILDRGIPSFADAARPIASLLSIYQERMPVYEAISANRVDVGILEEIDVIQRLCEMANCEECAYGL
jgi:shikimate kinase